MKKSRIFLLIVVVIGGIYLSYDYYFEEYGMYKQAMSSNWEYESEDYLYKFPEGRWVNEVQEHLVDVKYYSVVEALTISSIRRFRKELPNSKYEEQMIVWSDSLWNREIENYNQLAHSKGVDQKSVEFFRNLLIYMRDNHEESIYVKFNSKIDLIDFSDYSSEAQMLLNEDAKTYDGRSITDNIVSLKENFVTEDAYVLEKIVDNGIKRSFNDVFEQDFIFIQTLNSGVSEPNLVIELDYHIRNSNFYEKSRGIIYPDIWTYTIGEQFSTYLLGIEIDFDFNFKIPETDKQYSFSTSANAGESLSNLIDVKDCYKVMTNTTFQNYAQSVSDKFGLGSTYTINN